MPSASPRTSWAAEHDWLRLAMNALPAGLEARSPIYSLEAYGGAQAELEIALDPPPALASLGLAAYGWDGDSWRFLPATRAAEQWLFSPSFLPRALALFEQESPPPIIMLAQEVWQDLDADVAGLAHIISPAGLRLSPQGGFIGSLAPGGSADADYLLMPLLRNFSHSGAIDRGSVERLISQPAARQEHIKQITSLARFNSFAGIFIDYRGISAQYSQDFTRFIQALAASFAESGLRLGLALSAERDADGGWHLPGYALGELGDALDYALIRADLHPLDFAPGSPLDDLLAGLASQIDRRKLLLSLSALSQRELAGMTLPIGWHAAFAALGDVLLEAERLSKTGSIEPGTVIRASLSGYAVQLGIDSDLSLLYFDYLDDEGGPVARIWLTDAAALQKRLERLRAFGIAGIAFEDLLHADRFARSAAGHKASRRGAGCRAAAKSAGRALVYRRRGWRPGPG